MSRKMANLNFFTISQKTILTLKTEWQANLQKYNPGKSKIEEIFQTLVKRYSEKHRAYHNLSHINYLFKEAKNIEFEDFDSIFLTIWFHDAIYAPERNDNEIESARLAVKLLSELDFSIDIIIKIEKVILATQTHSAENLDDDGKFFLDLDLSILGANPEIYQKYSQAIRQEYSHVSDDLYRRGRSRILENFLEREVIYFTENLRQRFEKQARRNLANEIKELS
jgi:predicted metal-dependent HD superfamily phosphohydrolase